MRREKATGGYHVVKDAVHDANGVCVYNAPIAMIEMMMRKFHLTEANARREILLDAAMEMNAMANNWNKAVRS